MADRQMDDPATIERDIERTQDRMGDTVDQLEEKMTPKEVTRSMFGDDGQQMVREGLRLVRENPIPAAMIAVGAVWLFATSESPLIKRASDRLTGFAKGGTGKLRPRSEEPAPIGPPPPKGEAFDRRARESANRR